MDGKAEMSDIDRDTSVATGAFLKAISGRFPVTRAMLYGSRARRGHGAASDADVAVFLSGPAMPFADTKLAMADIAYDVLLETGILIQPLPVWEEEWAHPEAHANPRLLRNIAREGIPL